MQTTSRSHGDSGQGNEGPQERRHATAEQEVPPLNPPWRNPDHREQFCLIPGRKRATMERWHIPMHGMLDRRGCGATSRTMRTLTMHRMHKEIGRRPVPNLQRTSQQPAREHIQGRRLRARRHESRASTEHYFSCEASRRLCSLTTFTRILVRCRHDIQLGKKLTD